MTERLRILVDMDGVLVDLLPTWLDIYSRECGDYVHPDSIKNYNYGSYVRDPEIFMACLAQALDEAPPLPGSGCLTAMMSNSALDVRLVTFIAPPINAVYARATKLSWLQHWFPTVDPARVTFCGVERAEIRADVLIDDSPGNIAAFLKKQRFSKAYCVEHSYNNEWITNVLDSGRRRMMPVRSLERAYNLIQMDLATGEAA